MRLHRIYDQANETLVAYFTAFASEYGSISVNPALRMLDFVHALTDLAHADIWVFTSLMALVLATRDDYTSAVVRIEYSAGHYAIMKPTHREEPRFIGDIAIVSYHEEPHAAAYAAIMLFDQIVGAEPPTAISCG